MQASTEVMEFRVAKEFARHVIESQAGSVGKAVLELVMNAIDAGAGAVTVRCDGLGRITVEDDGHGFVDKAELRRHFATFGFDHDNAEERTRARRYGRFGIGRGQIMAFARTHWTSNHLTMEVDIRDKALELTVVEHDGVQHAGCRVVAELYRPMSAHEHMRMVVDLQASLRYSPVDVTVDGEAVSLARNPVAWTRETERLWWMASPHGTGGVEIHNEGVYVRTYPHSVFGCSGALVSRPGHTFALNTARNDVLQAKCTLWPQAKALLRDAAGRRRASTRLSDADRRCILAEIRAGEGEHPRAASQALLPTVHGRYVSFDTVMRTFAGRVTIAPSAPHRKGERAHDAQTCAVLAPSLGQWLLGWMAGQGDEARVRETLDAIWWAIGGGEGPHSGHRSARAARRWRALEWVAFDDVVAGMTGAYVPVDEARLAKGERAALAGIRVCARGAQSAVGSAHHRRDETPPGWQRRKGVVGLGESDVAAAWTDGQGRIYVDRHTAVESASAGLNGWWRLWTVLVHEWCHDGVTAQDHAHGPEFYALYHDAMQYEQPFEAVRWAMKAYGKERQRLGLRVCRREATVQRRIIEATDWADGTDTPEQAAARREADDAAKARRREARTDGTRDRKARERLARAKASGQPRR